MPDACEYLTGLLLDEAVQTTKLPSASRDVWDAKADLVTRESKAESLELVLLAESQESAQSALDLVLAIAGILTHLPKEDLFVWPRQAPLPPPGSRAFAEIQQPNAYWSQVQVPDIAVAVSLAAATRCNRDLEYAVHQLSFSHRCHQNLLMDVDENAWPYDHVSSHVRDHVRFAHAIVAAYGCLEQLGLGAPSNAFRKGSSEWNEAKRADLISMLAAIGVNETDKCLWSRRGMPSSVERVLGDVAGAAPEWCDEQIRDRLVPIHEGIRLSQHLRGRIASHRLGVEAAELSVHDVLNVQGTAGRVLYKALCAARSSASA